MEILKEKTKSLCSVCYKETDAVVYEESGQVYIRKKCSEHGELTSLAEKDGYFYKAVMRKEPSSAPCYNALLIPVEYRCNMRCNYCYLPYEGQKNIPFEKLRHIVDRFEGPTIALTGGEPTLRDDLADIIRYIRSKDKRATLITNGVRLADKDYLGTLKDAGLSVIFFGFNGFSDKADSDIYNTPGSYRTKLKALENIKKENIKTILAATIARGTNDNQLLPLFEYSARNCDFIHELRFRSVTKVGRHKDYTGFFVSELVSLFGEAIGISKQALIDNYIRNDPYRTAAHVNARIPFKNENGRIKVLPSSQTTSPKDSPGGAGTASVNIRFISWPDVDNFDAYEVDHSAAHLYNQEEIINFCKAIILNSKL